MKLETQNRKTLKHIGDYAARVVEWNKRDGTDNKVLVWMENGMLRYKCHESKREMGVNSRAIYEALRP